MTVNILSLLLPLFGLELDLLFYLKIREDEKKGR